MPWCPKCRSEYEDGVRWCPECQTFLVAALPSLPKAAPPPRTPSWRRQFWAKVKQEPAWEEEAPDSAKSAADEASAFEPNVVELAAAALARFACRKWPAIRIGLWMVPHSAWRALRMRNVWLLLLALAAVQAVWQAVGAARIARLGNWNGDQGLFFWPLSWSVRSLAESWRLPMIGSSLTTGVQEPLQSGFQLVGSLWFVTAGLSLAETQRPSWVSWLIGFGPIIPSLLFGAAAVASIYGWLAAAIRGEDQTWGRLITSARRSFLPVALWSLLPIGVNASWDALVQMHYFSDMEHPSAVLWLRSAAGLVLLPFALTSFTIVAQGTGLLGGIKAGLRVVRARWPALLCLLLASRAGWSAAYLFDYSLRIPTAILATRPPSSAIESGPYGLFQVWVLRPVAAWFLTLMRTMSWQAVGLVFCVGLMLVVVRSLPPKAAVRDIPEDLEKVWR